jgi:hypothetical protein
MATRATLLILLLSAAPTASAGELGNYVTPIWVESGANLLWNPSAPDPALSMGRASIINTWLDFDEEWFLTSLAFGGGVGNLPAGQTSETFAGNFLTGSTPLDGGQYYCYVVEGSDAGSELFAFDFWSFNCSQVPPDTDNSPSSASQVQGLTPIGPLQANNLNGFTASTWDAGFVGSIFRLDGGQGWQPWFRNGEEVLFDMPQQAPQGLPNQSPPAVSVDPGFYLGTVTFTDKPPAQQAIALPRIFATGDVIELQLSNSDAQGIMQAFGPVRVGILGGDKQYIGEATAGPVMLNLGSPRLSTYRIDAGNIIWTYPNTSLTLDMTGHQPQAGQVVTVAAVVHGYHEQLLK